MEEYEIIDGYENYEVSNLGNVRNVKTGKILKPRVNCNGYKQIGLHGIKSKTTPLHRLISLAFIDNPENKPCIDHIDNNRTNNNISNLRWATLGENSHNSNIRKSNTSGVKGVGFNKASNKWRARITVDGIKIHLGSYDTKEEAQEARIRKANEAFGNFANACEKV
jgi:hypothetical protein